MDRKEKGSTTLIVIGSIIGFFVLVIGLPLLFAWLGLITLPFLKFENKVALNQGVISKTYNTDYCLNNYHWFLETDQAIQQSDTQIANVQAQIADFKSTYGTDATKWNYAATQQYGQISASLTGIQNYRADLVGQYNARTQELDRVACKGLPLYVQP
ncbi:MAG: hypothetical protein ACYDER_29305 [Ktedonobacteraceae bacterium]